AGALVDRGVPGQESTTPAGAEQLGAAETQDASIAPGAGLLALDGSARALGGVLDNRDSVGRGNGHDLAHRHHAAVQMRYEDGSRLRPEGVFEKGRMEIPVVGMNIDQHRPGADGVDTEEIAAVIVSGQDDLGARADFEGAQGQLDGERTAGAGQGEIDAERGAETLLQAFAVEATVFSPGAVLIGGLED